jgi:hypothetical protein
MPNYDQKILEIISNAEVYHQAYYQVETFGGPSLYFHQRSLENGDAMDFTRRLEYIYATLTAWGMHRMSKGGSKMLPFNVFQTSVMPMRDRINEAATMKHAEMSETNWDEIKSIFKNIKVMKSGTSIVGNSKVLAHLIPNIVPPIDREYTLRCLRGNTTIANDLENEWLLMKDIISRFFIPISLDKTFKIKAEQWMSDRTRYPWDTSIFKIIDNLIIGARKAAL